MPDLEAPRLEYRFTNAREFRFDFAWDEQLLALEIQGGTYMYGRHSRGKGQRQDCEKNNLAVKMGWRVLYATTDMLRPRNIHSIVTLVAEIVKQPLFLGDTDASRWTGRLLNLQVGEKTAMRGVEVVREKRYRFVVTKKDGTKSFGTSKAKLEKTRREALEFILGYAA